MLSNGPRLTRLQRGGDGLSLLNWNYPPTLELGLTPNCPPSSLIGALVIGLYRNVAVWPCTVGGEHV